MAYYVDDEEGQPSLVSDLLGAGAVTIIPRGLAETLSSPPTAAPPAVAVAAPQAATVQTRIPTYIDSQTGRTVQLSPGTSPGAFAAQQQTPWENLLSGYGAETMGFGREAADLARRAVSAVRGDAGAVPAIQNPNIDIDRALFKTSLAADVGRMGADFVNTLPVAGIAGEVAAPVAQAIRGEKLLPTLTRAAIPGITKGVATGSVVPADDADERLHHILVKGGLGAGYALYPVVKMLARD